MNFYPSFRFVSLAFSVIFLLSGCGGGGGGGGGENTDVGGDAGGGTVNNNVATDSPPDTTDDATVGRVYTDLKGMTLYTFNGDALGVSK